MRPSSAGRQPHSAAFGLGKKDRERLITLARRRVAAAGSIALLLVELLTRDTADEARGCTVIRARTIFNVGVRILTSK